MTRVVHFDIPIDDPEWANAFYEAALGWNVERWGPVEYWILTIGREELGAEGP
jgi:predicted enzyme related to lactoylglutathione lyase